MFNSVRLRSSAEFRIIYSSGRRFDGRLMAVFVRPNQLERHRLGVTASRKFSPHAVVRNRAKRLLREAFHKSGASFAGLLTTYDWVLNAKYSLLQSTFEALLRDFQEVISRVSAGEMRSLPLVCDSAQIVAESLNKSEGVQ